MFNGTVAFLIWSSCIILWYIFFSFQYSWFGKYFSENSILMKWRFWTLNLSKKLPLGTWNYVRKEIFIGHIPYQLEVSESAFIFWIIQNRNNLFYVNYGIIQLYSLTLFLWCLVVYEHLNVFIWIILLVCKVKK